jgi:hypothetical protein
MHAKTSVLSFCSALGLILVAAPAIAQLSASATISTSQLVSPFTYTIDLTNTGSSPISTFWFAWTPPGQPTEYSFLPSVPTSPSAPSGWLDPVVSGFPGYSIEYYDGAGGTNAIQPGHDGLFQFTSADSPTTLQGKAFGVYPILDSTMYASFPESGSDVVFSATFVQVPEPSSIVLAGLGGLAGLMAWRRRRLAGA